MGSATDELFSCFKPYASGKLNVLLIHTGTNHGIKHNEKKLGNL